MCCCSLSDYFKGNNSAHVILKMTVPCLVDIRNSTYTMHLRVPTQYQSNVPAPVSSEVTVDKLPTHKYVAVRRFDGFITDAVIPPQIAALKKSLQGTPYQKAADLDLSTLVAYNAPFRTVDRVNEIFLWFD